jgi:hypothetical protein
MGGKHQAPAYQWEEEPIIVRRVEEVDDDQKSVHPEIDEEMNEKTPHLRIGEDRFAPPVRWSSKARSWAATPIPQPASTQMNQIWCGFR